LCVGAAVVWDSPEGSDLRRRDTPGTMTTNLKLASNWKSCGVGADMRRWSHGNARINFGFCKGDDNFGGRKRKELDDFLKSLGKQMNLVMYRMQDTENVRFRLREERRQDVRLKAEREEEREKAQMERLERNRKWREKKYGTENLEDIAEEKVLDEKEERIQKNKEWRERRENRGKCEESPKEKVEDKPRLSSLILPELHCQNCHELLSPPSSIFQCSDLHKTCQACRQGDDLKKCPLCSGSIIGRNVALENVAARLFSGKYKSDSSLEESLDLTLRSPSEGVGSSID